MQRVNNPVPIFLDARGQLLDGGRIYVGVTDGDPETDPIAVFWDEDLTQPAPQPIRTLGGRIVNGTQPASIFVAQDDYSMRILDVNGAQLDYIPSVYMNTDAFQPKDSDLTDIAALTTTVFGRSLLTLADQAALKTATGIPDSLPLAGGTVSGTITRQGGGGHWYWHSNGLPSGRIFLTPASDPDPTSQAGDVWFAY